MTSGMTRSEMLDLIRSNIEQHGHHVTIVAQGVVPRFAYTIGLRQKVGAELVFAGASTYDAKQIHQLINEAASSLRPGLKSLRQVDSSWVKLLLLGALDYYNEPSIPALQILPDRQRWTIEVPDMSIPFSPESEPVWQWLTAPWSLPIPRNSTAATNLGALRGDRVTEAARWEQDEWEIFAGSGPDTPKSEMRVIPFSTLYAVDPTLADAAALPVGSALWRHPNEAEWHDWSRRS